MYNGVFPQKMKGIPITLDINSTFCYCMKVLLTLIIRTSQDKEIDNDIRMDQMTWRQWLNNALKRNHGLFGEALEYYFIHQDDKIAYIKVGYRDRNYLSSAIATYISSDELVGHPLVVMILQETSKLIDLDVTADDKLWLQREIEQEEEDNLH